MVGACLSDIDLESFHAGALPADVTARLTGHIESCGRCQQHYERFLEDQDVLGRIRRAARAVGTDTPSSYLATQMLPRLIPALPRGVKGYDIRREIQRGGQGVVHEAVQLSTRRVVALKILLEDPFADPARRRRRFETEIELASNLRHPNIVAIHDSGLVDGNFYYAMEYIAGERLGEYLQARDLDLLRRVQLFDCVCGAVAYAHEHGVIHRDLKPSNIRVDPDGVPHLLDFGLARRLEGDGALDTREPGDHGFMGTLAYAAPEQFGPDPEAIDTRSDVYALGVLLYEMLSGRSPYPVDGELCDIVQHITGTPPARLGGCGVDGDLQAIVDQALAKVPAQRYRSAGHLHEDIRRYLRGEPVEAHPQHLPYIARKWLRRHRWGVASAAAMILALAGLAGWHVRAVQQERDEAVAQWNSAEQIQRFLEETFAAVPDAEEVDHTALREMLRQAARRVQRDLQDQPLGQAAVRMTIGQTYRKLGAYAAAEYHLQTALDLYRAELDPQHPDIAAALNNLALLRRDQGRLNEAEAGARESLQILQRGGASSWAMAEHRANLATILHRGQNYEEAAALYLQSLLFLRDEVSRAHTQRSYATLLETLGHGDEAEDLYVEALEVYLEHDVPVFHIAGVRANLAELYEAAGDLDAAEAEARTALELVEQRLGRESLQAAKIMSNLAELLNHRGRYEEATELALEALHVRETELGQDHEAVGMTLKVLAGVQQRSGDVQQAAETYEKALDILQARLGSQHPITLAGLSNLARSRYLQGDYAAATAAWEEVLEGQRAVLGQTHPDVATTLNNLGLARLKLGDKLLAQVNLLAAHDMRIELLGLEHADVAETKINLAALNRDSGNLLHAETLYRQALDIQERVLAPDDPQIGSTLMSLGRVLRARGSMERGKRARRTEAQALQAYERALYIFEEALPPAHPHIATVHENMAYLFRQQDDLETAKQHYRTALELRLQAPEGLAWRAALTQRLLSECLIRTEHFDEAEALLLASHDTLQQTLGPDHRYTRVTIKRLRDLYRTWDRPDDAAHYSALLAD